MKEEDHGYSLVYALSGAEFTVAFNCSTFILLAVIVHMYCLFRR